MRADLHVHTKYSCDSEAEMEQYIRQAMDADVQMICFTDHVDLNPNDYGYNYYDPKAFFAQYDRLKADYGNRIRICAGIEFGEPHLYAGELKRLSQEHAYDYIIGSIHWVGDLFPGQKVRERYSAEEFFTLYWEEVKKTVKQGGFDALGHMDFPKRYYGEMYYSEAVLNEIFQILLDKDMVIEINTSSLRKGYSETMPGMELLQIYKANGGKYVTIGSDAHEAKDLGADIHIAKRLIRDLSLQAVVYENRKWRPWI